jgi:hypothetical protein
MTLPDYTIMTGAEFQRAVGADPEKWAMAFVQSKSEGVTDPVILERRMHEVLPWFRDAMDAAVKAHKPIL